MYSGFFKRVFDFLFSLFVLVVLFVPLLIVVILVKFESNGPLFFRQTRVGKDLKTFRVYKFRTMTNEKREVGTTPIIGKADGVTGIGFYLRRFKVDELPQLLNILNGDMSIVGPRPSIPEQLDNMTDEEKTRYSVRPGLTGLAQINGNIHLQWKERFVYDLKYVKNITFLNDLKIVFRTLFIVLLGEEKFLNRPVIINEH